MEEIGKSLKGLGPDDLRCSILVSVLRHLESSPRGGADRERHIKEFRSALDRKDKTCRREDCEIHGRREEPVAASHPIREEALVSPFPGDDPPADLFDGE